LEPCHGLSLTTSSVKPHHTQDVPVSQAPLTPPETPAGKGKRKAVEVLEVFDSSDSEGGRGPSAKRRKAPVAGEVIEITSEEDDDEEAIEILDSDN
jgi:hypothetical protein